MTTTTTIEECDYLVVGAGAASMAFIDTILTELPSAKIVLVDKKAAPGGHWVDAYGFVHLHQPSLLYGVTSRSLEGSWSKLLLWNWKLPWTHRASKTEILTYFEQFVKDKVAAGQVSYYPNCAYSFDSATSNDNDVHSFARLDKSEVFSVKVKDKVVNGILGECKVPSQTPVEFPVDEGITLVTPNEIYESKNLETGVKKFVVLGAGKTAMDTVVYLQRQMKVKPDRIMWVISNDVWMLAREGGGNPWSWGEALLKNEGDRDKASLALEEKGVFVRLDKKILPSQFRFPMIGKDELALLRKIPSKNIIRRGRVTSMKLKEEEVVVGFGPQQDEMVIESSLNTVFVHCTSPGPFNGNLDGNCFVSDKMMNLNLLYAPPVSASMSCLGFLEAARKKETLDASFAIELQHALEGTVYNKEVVTTAEDIEKALGVLVKAILFDSKTPEFAAITNLGLFLCLADKEVSVGHEWMKQNRLSFLAIPGFKCKIYENIGNMLENREILGYSDSTVAMMKLLQTKLKPLEGQ